MNYLVLKLLIISVLYLPNVWAFGDNVIDFNDINFDMKVADHDPALVLFYAPWCGHCQKLKPKFAEAADTLAAENVPVAFAKVDCTDSGSQTCSKYRVDGYPTMKLFKGGRYYEDYEGPRDANEIANYMRNRAKRNPLILLNTQEYEQFLANATMVCVVGFFENEDSELKAAYIQASKNLKNKAKFARTSSPEILDKMRFVNDIILYQPLHMVNEFENSIIKYNGPANSNEIYNFIVLNLHGLVGHRKWDNVQDFSSPIIIAYYKEDLLLKDKSTGNYWRNKILEVAKDYKNIITFAVSHKSTNVEELEEFGIDANGDHYNKEIIIVARDSNNTKFIMKEDFSTEALQKFVNGVLNNHLEPYIKSEPIPSQNVGPVKIVVGKNFRELVLNNKKDVFLNMYAPWCGHCTNLAPLYQELGEKLKNENVDILKIDATANEVPDHFNLTRFPSLFWVTKNGALAYEGARTVDDMLKFIAKHATHELKSFDRDGKVKSGVKTEL